MKLTDKKNKDFTFQLFSTNSLWAATQLWIGTAKLILGIQKPLKLLTKPITIFSNYTVVIVYLVSMTADGAIS